MDATITTSTRFLTSAHYATISALQSYVSEIQCAPIDERGELMAEYYGKLTALEETAPGITYLMTCDGDRYLRLIYNRNTRTCDTEWVTVTAEDLEAWCAQTVKLLRMLLDLDAERAAA